MRLSIDLAPVSRPVCTLLAVCAAMTVVTVRAQKVQAPVVFDRITDGDAASGWLRAPARYVQKGGDPVWIEAEQATRLTFEPKAFENQDNAFLGEDPKAGAARYIAYVARATYDIEIATPGAYRVWYRAYFPWKGGWNHRECMVGDLEFTSVTDCVAGDKDTGYWRWVKGPVYTLTAGRHEWELSYQAGARLDRMVFTPDPQWQPQGDEIGPPAVVSAPERCVAVTRPLKPRALAGWLRAEARLNPGDGKILTEASLDGGTTFTEVRGGDLSHFAARGDGTDTLVLRYTLTPGPQGLSPSVQSAQVAYRSASKSPDLDLTRLPADMLLRPAAVPLIPMRGTGFAAAGNPAGEHPVVLKPAGEVYVPDGDGRFWLEAESATLLQAYPANGAATAVDGAVGKALYRVPVRPHVAVYDLAVPREAAYAVWVRIRQGRDNVKPKESSDIVLRLDDAVAVSGMIPLKTLTPGTWLWVKSSKTFPVAAGTHRLEWLGGASDLWVDRLCLAPEGMPAPEAQGGAASPTRPVTSAFVEFFPVFPPRGARWNGVDADGAQKLEVSLDGGTTWAPPPADLGDGELRVRAEIGRPVAVGVRLRPGATLLRLQDDAQDLWFEPGGGLFGLFHRARGEWSVPPGTRAKTFSLAYQIPGMARMIGLDSDAGRVVSIEAGPWALTWVTELLDQTLVVKTSVALGGAGPGATPGLPQWRVEVKNRSEAEIRHIDFPKIERVTLGGIRSDDTMLFPEAFGGALPDPYHTASYSYSPIIWPGTASMSWLDLSDQGGGLYVAACHPDMLGVEFDTGGNPDRASVRMSFKKQVYVGPGETWGGNYVVAAHRGDWHTGADLYRAWADSWMQKPRHPDWMRMCDGYSGLNGANGRFYSRYATHALPVYQWMGVDYAQYWGMSADGEFCGLTLWMNPRYGTAEELARSHDAMRKAGMHYTYYINAQGWFPGFSTLPKVGFIDRKWFPKDFSTYAPDFFERWGLREFGNVLTQYGAGVGYTDSDRIMCAASKGWHDRYLNDLAGRSIKTLYRSDGAYIDQMGCTFHYCFGEEHGHGKQHAQAGRGYAEIARDVLATGRRANPDCVLGVEGITDVLAQYVDWGLWVTRYAYKGEVFLYARPEAILCRGTANGQQAAFPSWNDCIADTFLYNRFDQIPQDPESLAVLRLRRRVSDWMYRGQFMDERGLTVTGAPVEARWFRYEDRDQAGAVINLHNWTGTDGGNVAMELDWLGGTPLVAIVYTDDDKARVVQPRLDGGRAVIDVPPNRCSAIRLLTRAPARGGVQGWALWPPDAGPNRLAVTVVNPASTACTVTLKLENASVLGAREPVRKLDVAARSLGEAVIELGDRNAYRQMTLARVRVTAAGGAQTLTVPVPPVMVNGDFELDVNRDRVPDGWGTWNSMVEHQFNRYVQDVNLREDLDGKSCSEQPFHGKACIKMPRAFDYQGKQLGPPFGMVKMHYAPDSQQAVFLRPGTRYRLTFAARSPAGNKGSMTATLAGLTIRENDVGKWPEGWKSVTKEFATAAGAPVMQYLTLGTDTLQPMYFDAVSLEELAPAAAAEPEKKPK